MSDVYDLRAANWCYVCEEAHAPCEMREDGNAYYFEPIDAEPGTSWGGTHE